MWPFSPKRQTIAAKFKLQNSFSAKANSDPAAQLSAEILDAAIVCASHFGLIASAEPQSMPDTATFSFDLAAEFAAAFTSLALELALIREHRDVLRHKLLFLFPHEIKKTFLSREAYYAECSQIFVPDKPLSGDGVVNKLALRVADICGSSFNPELLRHCAVVFASVSSELKLPQLVLACV